MRTGAPTDRAGYVHEAVLYDSDEKFLDVVVPFLRQGVAAGEPCLVALAASATGLVRAAMGDTTGLTFFDGRYDRPASPGFRSCGRFSGMIASVDAGQDVARWSAGPKSLAARLRPIW